MGLLQTVATDGASPKSRWRQALRFMVTHPLLTAGLLSTTGGASER